MIPWNKLPEPAQKTLLALVVLSSSAGLTGGCAPMVCDPAPPPATRTQPPPTPSPMIFDPAPPPSVSPASPTATLPTPAQPTAVPTEGLPEQSTARLVTFQIVPDPAIAVAAIRGRVVDAGGAPVARVAVRVSGPRFDQEVQTSSDGTFLFVLPRIGPYTAVPVGPVASPLAVEVGEHQAAEIEWQLIPVGTPGTGAQTPIICDPAPPPFRTPIICDPAPAPSPAPPQSSTYRMHDALPLAEIRTVEIVWSGGLTFQAQTPWSGARFVWSASEGRLIESGESVVWQPPAQPGHYLLQLIADWGPLGLAVDSITLRLQPDGRVMIG